MQSRGERRVEDRNHDFLSAAVVERRLDAAFIAQPPARKELSFVPLFHELLLLITTLHHKPVKSSANVVGESVIAFPHGCTHRRIVERWLGARNGCAGLFGRRLTDDR